MAELSPAAKAVLEACGTPDVDSPFRLVARGFAAAALRAAAEPFHWTWNAEMCHKHLMSIATELEAQ